MVSEQEVAIFLMGLDRASKALGVSIYTLRRLAAAGKLPVVYIGGRVMVSSKTIARAQQEGVGEKRKRGEAK